MARKNIGFLDVKEIPSDALVELFVDYLADGMSITRRVFGYLYSPFLFCSLFNPASPPIPFLAFILRTYATCVRQGRIKEGDYDHACQNYINNRSPLLVVVNYNYILP